MRTLRPVTCTVAGAGLALVLAVSACSSTPPKTTATRPPAASPSSGPVTITGRVLLTGAAAGKASCAKCAIPLPVKVTGLVADHGKLALAGQQKNVVSVVALARGGLQVRHSGHIVGTHFGKFTCVFTSVETGRFTVLPGGTGIYKGAHGHGAFTAGFGAEAAKNAKGACLTGKKDAPKALGVRFFAHGTLKLTG
jgi:hypothetical protein